MDGVYTYDFRSVVGQGGEGDDEDESEGGNDPFAIPDGGPIARIETKVCSLENQLGSGDASRGAIARLEAKLEAIEHKLDKITRS